MKKSLIALIALAACALSFAPGVASAQPADSPAVRAQAHTEKAAPATEVGKFTIAAEARAAAMAPTFTLLAEPMGMASCFDMATDGKSKDKGAGGKGGGGKKCLEAKRLMGPGDDDGAGDDSAPGSTVLAKKGKAKKSG